jgi:hypothetical protein
MLSHRPAFLGALAISLTMLIGCGSGSADTSAASNMPSAGTVADDLGPDPSWSPAEVDAAGPSDAAIDLNQVLIAAASDYPDSDGGTYWSMKRRKLVVRVVDSAHSAQLRARVESITADQNPAFIPVELAIGQVTLTNLRQAADQLSAGKSWAEPYADQVNDVLADELSMQVRLQVKSHAAELEQAAQEATGVPAYARVSKNPIGPL